MFFFQTGGNALAKAKSCPLHAGLHFPIGCMLRLLRKGRYAKRVGAGTSMYLAAVLKYLTAEMLDLAGTDEGKKKETK